MPKKGILISIFVVLTLYAQLSIADSSSDPNTLYPYLTLDAPNNPEYPRNFRSNRTPYPRHTTADAPIRTGLDTLNASGSAQFTQTNFTNMFRDLKITTGYIIDLRQESHGFLDTSPISWYGYKNKENENKTPQEIKALEEKLLEALALNQQKEILVYEKIKKDNKPVFKSKTFSYQTVSSEKSFVESQGFKYFRIYVLDRHPPLDAQIDQFVEFIKALPSNTWLHFHCRAGGGRTTTFMILYDMIRNADKASSDNIIRRQALIGGVNFYDMENLKPSQKIIKQERLQQIEKFYHYVKDPKGYAVTSWSAWKKENS